MRARELELYFGRFETGCQNLITDVEGVRVGHKTIKGNGLNTGVTVVMPHEGDVWEDRVPAGVFILNGYGKSTGLFQIEEMGYLETPIVITGTLNVGLVFDDVITWALREHPEIRSVNPVVLECNDSRLSDPLKREIIRGAFFDALKDLSKDFELGCVGAGTGMVAFGFKSGVGSSSRVVGDYTVGILTVPNFGKREDLILGGKRPFADDREVSSDSPGSIIIVIATNAPLTSRQLRRLAVRASHGIARVGGRSSNRSGDIIVAFSNSIRLPRERSKIDAVILNDDSPEFQDLMDAVIEATEESILDSLTNACDSISYDGKEYKKIRL